MPSFQCQRCGSSFDLPEAVLAKYPGWTPRQCRPCRDGSSQQGASKSPGEGASKSPGEGASKSPGEGAVTPPGEGASKSPGEGSRAARRAPPPRDPAAVLATATLGPRTGVFTDGSAIPNPGPGGWGVVWVEDDAVRDERHGHDPDTTNNRMELTAVWEALKMVPRGVGVTVHSDSELVVNTFNLWAASWKRNGWKRKTGAIKNLDLVQVIFAELQERPEISLTWVPAHSGWRWNEYADALAGRWMTARNRG